MLSFIYMKILESRPSRYDRGINLLSLGAAPRGRLPGTGATAYWQAIAHANRELDRWVLSDGAYVSKLKVRPFRLPAPGVSLEHWKKLSLPLAGTKAPAPEFMFRAAEQLFCIPAAAGDDVRLTIIADSAHPYKKKQDAVAIVVVDPDGEVVRRDKLTIEDLDAKARPDRRYGGRRGLTFRASESGTYGLFLNGLRYAYTLGASSHAWVASLAQPKSVRLWRPKRLFVKTLAGAKEAKLDFGFGNTTTVTVSDLDGNELASQRIGSDGGSIAVALRATTPHILEMTFESGVVVSIAGVAGLEPWFAAAKNAPFPRQQ